MEKSTKTTAEALRLFRLSGSELDYCDTDILLPSVDSPLTPGNEYPIPLITMSQPPAREQQKYSSTSEVVQPALRLQTMASNKPQHSELDLTSSLNEAMEHECKTVELGSPIGTINSTMISDTNNNAGTDDQGITLHVDAASNASAGTFHSMNEEGQQQLAFTNPEANQFNSPATQTANGVTLLLNNESLSSMRVMPRKGSHGSYGPVQTKEPVRRKFSLQLNRTNRRRSQDCLGVSQKQDELEFKRRHSLFGDMGNPTNFWQERRPSVEIGLKNQLFSFFQASDNKLAMKLFGSRTALLKEKRRQLQTHTWVIHPCSNFRLYWDLLMLIFLATNLVVLPVAIAFFFDDVGMHWIIFNITCDTLFILDIFINFRTGLIDQETKGDVILDPKIVAKRYLKGWFIIDFVSSLPLDYIFLTFEGESSYTAGRAIRILRLAKLLQLLRLLRISRLVRYVRIWQEYFSLASIVVRIFNLISVMVLLSHWSGCIQFFVPVIQNWPEDSWIAIEKLHTVHWWDQYTKSLFKALSHMLCIGYGQFPPRNNTDMWLTIASMLAGATCYALFVGHATTLIQSFDTSSRQFRDHLQQVNEYMSFRKLPAELKQRITTYYDHRFGGKMFDEQVILHELSDALRNDIVNHNCKELVKTVPFFINADPNFVSDVITKLNFEMFMPGDIIIKENTKGDRMFFIQEGVVEIVGENDRVVTRLADGSYFGEISLLSNTNRTATVRATTYCNLFSLSREQFDHILSMYPVMRRTLETIAAQRLHHLGKDPALVTSRESLLDDISGIQKVMQVDPEPISEDEHETEDDKSTKNNQFLSVFKSFFTKDSDNFSRFSSSRIQSRNNSRANSPNRDSNINANCSSNDLSGSRVPFSLSRVLPINRKVRSSVDLSRSHRTTSPKASDKFPNSTELSFPTSKLLSSRESINSLAEIKARRAARRGIRRSSSLSYIPELKKRLSSIDDTDDLERTVTFHISNDNLPG